MTTHVSATALEETPHETETIQITITDALRDRALSLINDSRTDPQWRTIIRYALEVNDPWLADIVRRAEAGEKIIDSTDFTLEPQFNEDDSHKKGRCGMAGVYVLIGPFNTGSGQTIRIQFRGTNDITLQ